MSDGSERRRGRVLSFDAPRGRGEIDSAGDRFGFHCTEIADGTRTIAVGTAVDFEVVPGPLGRWEAGAIERAGANAASGSRPAGAPAPRPKRG